jgi:hypothetical protein
MKVAESMDAWVGKSLSMIASTGPIRTHGAETIPIGRWTHKTNSVVIIDTAIATISAGWRRGVTLLDVTTVV